MPNKYRPNAKPFDVGPLSIEDALYLLLDAIDYTNGACRPTEMISALIPPGILKKARTALEIHKEKKP